jgi:hypothetical protein
MPVPPPTLPSAMAQPPTALSNAANACSCVRVKAWMSLSQPS